MCGHALPVNKAQLQWSDTKNNIKKYALLSSWFLDTSFPIYKLNLELYDGHIGKNYSSNEPFNAEAKQMIGDL